MNTPPLTIHLFGPLRVLVHGEPLPRVRTRSVEWLLALLALRQGRAVPRVWLAGTLWPESRESQALQNLRNDLMWLRQALGPEARRIQSPSRDTLTLDLEGAEVDIVRFDAAIRVGDEDSLHSAVSLYVGPLLEGCYEEWATAERETRDAQCLEALETLAERAGERGSHAEAIRHLRRAEALDPLRDSVARRLMASLAASGDFAVAVEVYRELRNRLHADLAASPDPETTHLFHQIRARARQPAKPKEGGGNVGPARSEGRPEEESDQRPRPSVLVHPLTTLIGREEEVETVGECLRESRLVTLVGAGGVGKTRLAMEVAARMEAAFDAGAIWVELAPLADGAPVLPAIGAALGIQEDEETEGRALTAQVLARLSAGSFLLALDNCEHLLDSAAEAVERLLQACRDLRVLATSRQRLGLAGEVVWHVPSLSAPESGTLPEEAAVEHALAYPAVRLFVERAAAARPGFRLADHETAEAVCTLCRRLDGIPLALELAAARVGTLTPGQIAARLDDRFALLTQGARTALPRQKTLRALMDWSYDLLEEKEKTLLRRLSVFADGWTLEAAEGVSGARSMLGGTSEQSGTTSAAALHALDLLASLTDKSLVVAEERAGGLRYRMLETIRQYAAERLRESGEEDARRRFLDWAVTLAESAYGEMLGPHPDAALDRLEAEKGNLREALAWTRSNAAPPGMYLRLTASLWPFWEMRGYVPQGRVHLLAAVERPDLPDAPARAHALLGAATLLIEKDITPQAIAYTHESLERFRALDDAAGTASALLLLGHMGLRLLHMGDAHASSQLFTHAGTRALLTEGLALCRDLRWVQATALVLVHLGLLTQIEGDAVQGRALREEGWGLLDRGDDGRTPAYCLNSMNTLATTLYVAAGERALLERSLALARKTGKKRRVVAIVQALGKVAEWQGDSSFAIACFREVAQTYQEMGNEHALSEALQQLGNIYYRLGDYRSASPIYAESLELFRKLDYAVERAANNLGSTLFHLGELEQARRLHREALAGYGSNIEGIAWSLERLAIVEAAHGDAQKAAHLLGAASSTRERLEKPMDRWDQEDWDQAVASTRAGLHEMSFASFWEDGRAMTMERAIDLALEETEA